jgi:hypothetical protein
MESLCPRHATAPREVATGFSAVDAKALDARFDPPISEGGDV